MTNAEKFLKDGVDIEELVKEIEDYVDKKFKEEYSIEELLKNDY